MPKGLVLYYSRSGNTKKMAEVIADAMGEYGVSTDCREVGTVSVDDFLTADAIVIGSPTYYGHMAAPIVALLDESNRVHRKLDGKVGAAFSSSGNIGGGNETTIMNILHAFLIHGMVVQGDPKGDHYGPVSIGKPEEKNFEDCRRMAARIAELTLKLHG